VKFSDAEKMLKKVSQIQNERIMNESVKLYLFHFVVKKRGARFPFFIEKMKKT